MSPVTGGHGERRADEQVGKLAPSAHRTGTKPGSAPESGNSVPWTHADSTRHAQPVTHWSCSRLERSRGAVGNGRPERLDLPILRILGAPMCSVCHVGAAVEVKFLGPFEVRVDHKVVVAGGMRQRGLLAILALNRNEVVSTRTA